MKLYHRTFAADAILKDGFKDASDYYMSTQYWIGVWFSDRPLDIKEGADGDRWLMVEISEDAISDYEWIEDEKTYREWLIPAKLINSSDPPIEICEICAKHPIGIDHDCTWVWPI